MSRFYFATPSAFRTVADEFRHWFGPAVLALVSAIMWDVYDLTAEILGYAKRKLAALKVAIVARLPKMKARAVVIGHHIAMPAYVAATFAIAFFEHVRELPEAVRDAYSELASRWRNA